MADRTISGRKLTEIQFKQALGKFLTPVFLQAHGKPGFKKFPNQIKISVGMKPPRGTNRGVSDPEERAAFIMPNKTHDLTTDEATNLTYRLSKDAGRVPMSDIIDLPSFLAAHGHIQQVRGDSWDDLAHMEVIAYDLHPATSSVTMLDLRSPRNVFSYTI